MDELRTVSRDATLAARLPNSRANATRRRSLVQAGQGLLMHLLVWAGAIGTVVPFLWMVSTSLKSQGGAMAYPPEWIPNPIHWENYVVVVQSFPFGLFAFNSTKIAVLGTIGQLVSTSLAAYAFSRMNFPGRQTIFYCLLATLMIPGHVTMIPTFILFNWLGWVNTHWPLFVPAWFGGAFGTFLIRQFFLTLPQDYSDAAAIDGAGHFRIFVSIYVPLAMPVLATLALFAFMGSWNEFLLPVIYLTDENKMTLTVGLSSFRQQYTTLYNYLMAGTLLSLLPILVLFVALQKYFVSGIVMTGIKG